MQFLNYQIPFLGNGMTIGLVAVIHVLFSHGVAIGAFSIIVWSEYRGWKNRWPEWDNFARDLLKVVVFLITVIGAITGVGIWFTIGTLEARGTSSMLRIFFWPWFIEWLVFAAEVIILLAYYFTWNRWQGVKKKRHLYLGIAYVGAALLSAFIITGILGFMLTPDQWPWQQNFWAAFFNSSFIPQLLLRLGGAYILGVIVAMVFVVFSRRDKRFKQAVLAPLGWFMLAMIGLSLISTGWYFAVVPTTFKDFAPFAVLTSNFSHVSILFWSINILGLLALVILAVGAARRQTRAAQLLVIPALILTIGFFTEFERIREFIRGPYVIPGYMYANEVLLKESPYFTRHGLLPNSYWFNATASHPTDIQRGAYLFGQNCSVCHTIGGINDIAQRVEDRTEPGILVIIQHSYQMVPFMPQFSGTPEEQRILAHYLYQLGQGQLPGQAFRSRFIPVSETPGETTDGVVSQEDDTATPYPVDESKMFRGGEK